MRKDYRRVRIVIDTNLYISMLIGKRTRLLRQLFVSTKYELIISYDLIDEIIRVASRPKFARYFHADDVKEFIEFLKENSTLVHLGNIPKRCRDPKDDFLLELAMNAGADILLSGDTDLTDIKHIGHCKIMTVNEFIIQN